MSYSIVKKFKFVALNGANTGKFCALALMAANNVTGFNDEHIYEQEAFICAESLGVARAITASLQYSGDLSVGDRSSWSAVFANSRCVDQDSLAYLEKYAVDRLCDKIKENKLHRFYTTASVSEKIESSKFWNRDGDDRSQHYDQMESLATGKTARYSPPRRVKPLNPVIAGPVQLDLLAA